MRPLAEDLWTLELPLVVGGLHLGTRTTAVRLPDGGLWLHSPGPIERLGGLAALGPVRHVVAPNRLHNRFVAAAKAAFPDAIVWAPAGIRSRVPDLPVDRELAAASSADWREVIDLLAIGGLPDVEEWVFLHRPSRTLLLTDLAFHLRHSDHAPTRWGMTLNGAYGCFGPSRLFRWVLLRDRAALRASLDRVLAWDFDRVVVAHGEVVESGGRDTLRDAFAWV